jgi:subtilisin family serine protease
VISGLNFGNSLISLGKSQADVEKQRQMQQPEVLAGKAVVNISIGGSKSTALNSAVAAATKAGVVCVVAAGNENVCLQFMSNDEADMK